MEDTGSDEQTRSWGDHPQKLARKWFWVPVLIGALGFLLVISAWEQSSPEQFVTQFKALDDIDLEQGRVDTALPLPRGDFLIAQTFVPHHDGLQEIELMLAQYGDSPVDEGEFLTLELIGPNGDLIAEKILATGDLTHNQIIRFSIPRQMDSKDEIYTLKIDGTPENNYSLWGYSLDVYGDGALSLELLPDVTSLPATLAEDLRFTTRYQLTWSGILSALGSTFYFEGLFFLLALFTLPLPGCLALLIFSTWKGTAVSPETQEGEAAWPWDPAAWWGVALALGVSTWPLLWLWWSLPGGRWYGWLHWLLVIAGWAAVFWLWWRDKKARRRRIEVAAELGDLPPHSPPTLSWHKAHLLLFLLLFVGLAVRLLAVRDVVFPLWVDSSRHGLITAVMTDSGQAIDDYGSYLDVNRFPYHYGFHTLSSSLAMMSGWPLPRLLLYLGQLLNGLVPLTMYAAVWLLTRRRGLGLLAAFIVALPLFFPGYYATWGRFTQLTAVLILPILIALTWLLARDRNFWSKVWWMIAVLAAGLFMTHFRVFIYYLPLALIVGLVSIGRNAIRLLFAAGLGLLLVLPRLLQLLADSNPRQTISRTIANYNDFPTTYFETGWEQFFVYAAAGGLLLVIIAAVRRRNWALLPLVLVSWVVALFLLLSADRLGLPGTALVNLNSMYIILFVPLAIFLTLIAGQLWSWLHRRHWVVQIVGYGFAGALLAALAIFGVRQQIGILNTRTVLAEAEDLVAIRWVAENLPEEAYVAVNSWRWLGQTWAAADGGAWLLPLTGRQVTTPPIDHIYNPLLFQEVRAFNEAASAVSDWTDPAQVDWLREQGVTHIFVGKKGGFFDPAKLAANPELEMIYGHQGVFIFALGE